MPELLHSDEWYLEEAFIAFLSLDANLAALPPKHRDEAPRAPQLRVTVAVTKIAGIFELRGGVKYNADVIISSTLADPATMEDTIARVFAILEPLAANTFEGDISAIDLSRWNYLDLDLIREGAADTVPENRSRKIQVPVIARKAV